MVGGLSFNFENKGERDPFIKVINAVGADDVFVAVTHVNASGSVGDIFYQAGDLVVITNAVGDDDYLDFVELRNELCGIRDDGEVFDVGFTERSSKYPACLRIGVEVEGEEEDLVVERY